MKKVLILTVAIFVAMSTFVIAANKDYYQQYRAPMYGTYRPTMPYGNMQSPKGYGNMPLMYGNHRPPMNYGNRPPMYGQMPPYGNMQSHREGRPPMHYGNMPPMYGNHRPPMNYGNRQPMYGNRPPMQKNDKNQKYYPVTIPLFDESRPVAR